MAIFQKDGKFYIDYRYQGRRIRECVGPTKRMAEKALAVRKGEILQGRYQIRKRGNVRLDIFAKTYLDHAKTNKRSWQRDEGLLKNLLPFFGNRLLSDINPFLIESYKKKRLDEVKPATVNREIALLKHMYNLAIRWGRVITNPMRDVRLLREENVQERILNQEETEKLLGGCTEYSRPIVLTALHTGMRLGEVLSLKWDQVEPEGAGYYHPPQQERKGQEDPGQRHPFGGSERLEGQGKLGVRFRMRQDRGADP